jgi:hypothetical protein
MDVIDSSNKIENEMRIKYSKCIDPPSSGMVVLFILLGEDSDENPKEYMK